MPQNVRGASSLVACFAARSIVRVRSTYLVRDDGILVDVHLQLRDTNVQVGFVELVRYVPPERAELLSFHHQCVEEAQTCRNAAGMGETGSWTGLQWLHVDSVFIETRRYRVPT